MRPTRSTRKTAAYNMVSAKKNGAGIVDAWWRATRMVVFVNARVQGLHDSSIADKSGDRNELQGFRMKVEKFKGGEAEDYDVWWEKIRPFSVRLRVAVRKCGNSGVALDNVCVNYLKRSVLPHLKVVLVGCLPGTPYHVVVEHAIQHERAGWS